MRACGRGPLPRTLGPGGHDERPSSESSLLVAASGGRAGAKRSRPERPALSKSAVGPARDCGPPGAPPLGVLWGASGGSMFAYPEHLATGLKTLFAQLRRDNYLRGPSPAAFAAGAAHVLAELNALHPFRDGNGRTQLIFLADQAGHPLELTQLEPE